MATILEHFQHDFKELSLDTIITLTYTRRNTAIGANTNHAIEVKQRLQQESNSSARFFVFYIPDTPDTLFACQTIISDLEKWKEQAKGIETISGFSGDKAVGPHYSVYSSRVFFYTERLLKPDEITQIENLANEKKLYITLRSQDYRSKKMELEKPFAFISHDSRDKDLIGRPLAEGLNSRLCFVWYDEFSLKVGESLRASIEKGIREAKKCIIVLTPNFLSNPGWAKKEFDSIFTREMIMNERIVIPIWYGVSKQEIYQYSASLADTLALVWPSPENKSDSEYKREVEIIISKIHTALTS